MIEENPGHSAWYIERFRAMAAEGADLDGESRFVDAMVPRRARILDAGCGPGRVGGRLADLGHVVVGVDIDPALIKAAQADHPAAAWITADIASLDLPSAGIPDPFDLIVAAGNVMTFLDPLTRTASLGRLAAHLVSDGRLVVGFGSGRDYEFEDFVADANRVGLVADLMFSSWDMRPFDDASEFMVAVLSRRISDPTLSA